MASPAEITIQQLNRLIGTPAAPMIIDARIEADFDEDPRVIPSAIRHPHDSTETLLNQINDRSVVVYCQKGHKISQGMAALLRSYGVKAEFLQGGQMGWASSNLPLVEWTKIPLSASGHSLWVTRHRPKIDRIACPWLTRRFVDAKAQFLFVAPVEVMNVATKFNATPFDIEDVFWSHRDEFCTFDVMVKEFGLNIEALNELAKVIRGADTNRHELATQAAGLLAFSVGMSRMFRDDNVQLDKSMFFYDALFRWARDGMNESHDWPTSKG
jgi:rhodanese-related sulfurtransferase